MSGITVTEDAERLAMIRECLRYLASHAVAVGIPAKNDARPGPYSNTALLALHEAGSPVNRVPPRPVLKPALSREGVREEMADALLAAVYAAAEGSAPEMTACMEKAGEAGVKAVRDYVKGGGTAPNAPITVSGGWMRNRVSGKPVHIKGKGGSVPLVDTGTLLNAFGYEIREET